MEMSRRFKCNAPNGATVKMCKYFDPEADAQRMKNSLESDTDDVIKLISRRSMAQRMEIELAYRDINETTLFGDIKRQVKSKKFQKVMIALFTPPEKTDAVYIKKALESRKENLRIIEILKTRDQIEIDLMQVQFQIMYDISLYDAIRTKLNGQFRNLCLKILETKAVRMRKRRESVSLTVAAKNLHRAMQEDIIYESERVVNEIFSENNPNELKNILEDFNSISGEDIISSIRRRFHGQYCEALVMMVEIAKNVAVFYAKKLRDCEKKTSDRHTILARLIVSRCEVDMAYIKNAFWIEYDTSMETLLEKITKGTFRKVLLSLIRD